MEISAERVFADSKSVRFPGFVGDKPVFVSEADDGSARLQLVVLEQGSLSALSHADYSLKNKINECGGRPWWPHPQGFIFVNETDQCLYLQSLDASVKPQRVSIRTESEQTIRYADLNLIDANRALAVVEWIDRRTETHQFAIAELDFGKPDREPRIVHKGADFYANLVFDNQHKQLAWIEWNHPYMPWDQASIHLAQLDDIDDRLAISSLRQFAPAKAAPCQLVFAGQGVLYFAMDMANADKQEDNYWNLWQMDCKAEKLQANCLTDLHAEIGYPHWQFGDARITKLDNNHLLFIASDGRGDKLYRFNLTTRVLKDLSATAEQTISAVQANGQGQAIAVVSPYNQPTTVLSYTSQTQGQMLWALPATLNSKAVLPQAIAYQTLDGAQAYAWYYRPPALLPAPLLVMVHGGPTARAYASFDLQKQFWLARGFAILDINHRGSIGYGRAYRDALNGHWGVMEVNDTIAAIRHLIEQNQVDDKRVFIRGKSAGGYTVLAALTRYPEVFAGGASYYGIGDLLTLAEHTHKFERYYTDTLIGENYVRERAESEDSEYFRRSPQNFLARLNCPMIVFQGRDDNIVPVVVAEQIVSALGDAGIACDYVLYDNEGHGFKSRANNIDALEREYAFYLSNSK